MMLSGNREAVLHQIHTVDIHTTRYYDVAYTHVGEERLRTVRLGPESVYEQPQSGDKIIVQYVMGVAVGIQPLSA